MHDSDDDDDDGDRSPPKEEPRDKKEEDRSNIEKTADQKEQNKAETDDGSFVKRNKTLDSGADNISV